jgi:hypothetical protein
MIMWQTRFLGITGQNIYSLEKKAALLMTINIPQKRSDPLEARSATLVEGVG